jgi:putative effector of murein hydrolase LrgA (UPF0299 family)
MFYVDLSTLEWFPIIFATVLSTFVVMIISDKVSEYLQTRNGPSKADEPFFKSYI